ncbi:hypothetical protein NZD89_12180 [Alicyclobacillus fastidiosus]|uniref:ATP-binding protein n=1 Tax=Alicyclobacillus fastidiosus TaxID=392011 RepID=A0ABY6ZMJ2_9BACL|nr:hypothetical protein [Alicyclobacillus fastidiosus]WAH44064.1 hypothetical protein NZD89_12180 [Alicyclobacillus fastidiosus]GMA60351.1 ATP-binding protein [Alicyclobacillus fastidiosus]
MGDVTDIQDLKVKRESKRTLADELAATQEESESQRDKLIKIGMTATLFHDDISGDRVGYATIKRKEHREVWPIRSKRFKDWLRAQYVNSQDGKGVSSQAVQETIDTLDAIACWSEASSAHKVHQRVAWDENDGIWIDLCDEKWQAVKVSANGWEVVDKPDVYFTRKRGMLALPQPVSDGDWSSLWSIANLKTKEQRIMAIAWLLGALRPAGPYPILVVEGEQGSGKSLLSRLLRGLIDPNEATSRRPPRDERDLFIAAGNNHVVAFENLSGLPQWLSDALCVLSTGGGFATRALYENSEETIINAMRPILLNGIDAIATRGDLRDRTLLLTLNRIPDDERQSEAEIWHEYERVKSQIFGLLLDAVSAALRYWDSTKLEKAPRMADFARWIIAAEQGGSLPWDPGEFLEVYLSAQTQMTAQAIESDKLAQAIIDMMRREHEGGEWTGTATQLAHTLTPYVENPDFKRDTWLYNPRVMGNRLRRIAPDLRVQGLDIRFGTVGHEKTRIITLEDKGNSLSATSATPAWGEKTNGGAESWADKHADNDLSLSAKSRFLSATMSAEKSSSGADLSVVADNAGNADKHFPTLSIGPDVEVFD